MTPWRRFDIIVRELAALLDGNRWLPAGAGTRGRGEGARLRGVAALLVVLGGCDVTPDKIERWKGTEKGPGKLREALRSGSLSPELRAQALTALVEIGSLSELADDLKQIPDAQKAAVVHGALRALTAMARGKGSADPASTTRLERNGKDALFLLRDAASADDRAQIDQLLIEWTTADLEGRMTAGAASGDKVLAAVGAAAGPRLAALLADPATSDANRTAAARLLGKVGDHAGREQGGAALVERARRDRQPSEVTLAQLGLVGGDHVVAYLSSLAADGRQGPEVREKALVALSQAPDAAELGPALRLAGDARAPAAVRDAAFELLSKLGPAAVPGLARLLADRNEKIRWEAAETMLLAGRAEAIPAVLEGLPTGYSYPREDLADFLVRPMVKLGGAALPALREGLRSPSWVARLAAAMALGQIGRAEDARQLEALAADPTRLKGWPAGATLGTEARTLAAAVRARP